MPSRKRSHSNSRRSQTVFANCPECGGTVNVDHFEPVCQDCGLVVHEVVEDDDTNRAVDSVDPNDYVSKPQSSDCPTDPYSPFIPTSTKTVTDDGLPDSLSSIQPPSDSDTNASTPSDSQTSKDSPPRVRSNGSGVVPPTQLDGSNRPFEKTNSPDWGHLSPALRSLGLGSSLFSFDSNFDSTGSQLDQSERHSAFSLKRTAVQNRFSPHERNLFHSVKYLSRVCSTLSLPHRTKRDAISRFAEAYDSGLISSPVSFETAVLACIYQACRVQDHPRTVCELSADSVADVTENELWSAYRRFSRELNWKTSLPDATQYVARIIDRLPPHKPERLRPTSDQIAFRLHDQYYAGRGVKPISISAIAIYFAAFSVNSPQSLTDLSEASDVSMTTLRKRKSEIQESVSLEPLVNASVVP